MTRFAWLQARTQTLVVAATLAALAILAAVTGVQLSHLYSSLVAHCQSGCQIATDEFLSHDHFLQNTLDILTLIAPALFGIFWGAPLVARELETGTYRLAWTQGVTRSRWLLTKLAVGALATTAAAGALTLTVTWWYRAIDKVGSNQYDLFERRDLVPITYALFAFASGALIGALVRRTVPAMAGTLGVYVFARVAASVWIRPHLLSPTHAATSLLDTGGFGFISRNGSPITLAAKGAAPQNAWALSSQFVTTSGHHASSAQLAAFVHSQCPEIAAQPPGPPTGKSFARLADPATFEACRARAAQAFHLLITYQPAGRYWTFQWLESGIFVALALIAAAGCFWWVTKRS
jgi:hypothetical protein